MADLTEAQAGQVVNIADESGNEAIVKAASTAAAATDASLVVALSPNSPSSGAVTTAAPTYSTGTTQALSLDTSGNLRVNINAATSDSATESYTTQGEGFSIATGLINAASTGSDNPLLLVNNPNASGKTLYLNDIVLGISTTNRAVNFQVFATPTVTANGSAVTIVNNSIGNATASVATIFTLPSVSASGSLLRSFANGQNTLAFPYAINGAIQIPPNHKLLITGNPSANTTSVAISFSWTER